MKKVYLVTVYNDDCACEKNIAVTATEDLALEIGNAALGDLVLANLNGVKYYAERFSTQELTLVTK